LHLSELQLTDNRTMVNMVESVLNLKSYYFATDFDITHSLQRLSNTSPEFLQMPLHERADQRFVWNNFMLRDLALTPEAYRFTLPIMLGFVETRQCVVAAHVFQLALISRRSCLRAGVRFQTRGIDAEGHAANFVETEQILEYGAIICSFVQTRGSIPIHWSQKPNLRWQPFPKIKAEDHVTGFIRHMQTQIFLYGNQCIVSLVNLHGRELTIASVMKNIMINNPPQQVRLVEFDFHKEGYQRLANLVSDHLAADAETFGYFATRRDGQGPRFIRQQNGVFRTNCIDCLDRTNVVQSMLAKRTLEQQLKWLQVLVGDDLLIHYADFERSYKNLWADNGDMCSMQYAGTCALKGDVTRTGSRTHRGKLNDLKNAVTRWFINNFWDGYRQDAIDLCLGNVAVDEQAAKSGLFSKKWDWHTYIVLGLVLTIAMLILTYFLATEHYAAFMLFWVILIGILVAIIWSHGEDFVNKPILKQE